VFSMTSMTGGEAVVLTLESIGVRHVFGIVSVHNLPIFDAVSRSKTVKLIPCRHEQGAVHAADGYARSTGEIGVAITSTGPGAANAMGGMFEAYTASSPVLMITGQVGSSSYGKGQGELHEAESQMSMLECVTCCVEHVSRHSEIVPALVSVISEIRNGRPRPGAVEIPIDLQYAVGEVQDISVPIPPRTMPPQSDIDDAAVILESAVRPLLVAGGGVVNSDASENLVALAERIGAPVLTTIEGRGSIPEDHPLAMGPNTDMVVMDPLFYEADVVLAVGTRFQQSNNTHKGIVIPGRLLHLDVDPGMIGLVHETELALVGDARLGLAALVASLRTANTENDWLPRAQSLREHIVSTSRNAIGLDISEIMDVIARRLPRNGIVAKDATISAYLWANRVLPVYEPRTSMRPVSMAIGPGVPMGIGAAIGSGQPTVVVQGDGGLMLSLGEMATIVQEQIPLVICVFNDRGYGILRFIQKSAIGGRQVGVDLETPAFSEIAEAFGMDSAKVCNPREFEKSFGMALDSQRPFMIEIDLSSLAPMRIQPQGTPVRD